MIPESMKITDSGGGEKFGPTDEEFIRLSQADVSSIADLGIQRPYKHSQTVKDKKGYFVP
jgi:hypothetical protein